MSYKKMFMAHINTGPEFFDLSKNYGRISQGKQADILILDENPSEDIQNLDEIQSVIRKGKVYDKARL